MGNNNFPDINKVHTIIFDFDGVFTNNKVYLNQDGSETIKCDKSDSLGLDIFRNFLKINATIYNAKQILNIQKEYLSFKKWLDHHLHFNINEWTELFKKTFKFTGPKITKEFLMSSGYLSGAHNKNCKVYNLILKENPPWLVNLKLKS